MAVIGAPLAALATVAPVQAAPSLSLDLEAGWGQAAPSTGWIPYTLTIANTGPDVFSGTVILTPPTTGLTSLPDPSLTTYREDVTVGRGGQRVLRMYAPASSVGGYRVDVVDTTGKVVESAPASNPQARTPIMLLSESGSAVTVLTGEGIVPPAAGITGVEQEASSQSVPNRAAYLRGLAAVVIEDFDTATLSQAQLDAIRDYVGLGGRLVLIAGSSWRRSISPLPQDLTPLIPSGTGTVSLEPIATLAGLATDVQAPVATGQMTPAARPVISDSSGIPLIVEADYGSGKIVELAFDPDAGPVSDLTWLQRLAWSQVVDRTLAVAAVSGASFRSISTLGVPSEVDYVANSPASLDDTMYHIVRDTIPEGPPPAGVLFGLLVFYVMVVGGLNYAVLARLGRREMMWITLPVVVLLFTGASYWAGVGARGTSFLDNSVQVFQVAPQGAVEISGYHAIFNSSSGDFTLALPQDALVKNFIGSNQSDVTDTPSTYVELGRGPQVVVQDAPVWSTRTVAVERPTHRQIWIAANLAAAGDHITGSVTNEGFEPVRDLRLVSIDSSGNREARLVDLLNPGASRQVDTTLITIPSDSSTDYQQVIEAASQLTAAEPGQLTLAGEVTADRDLTVPGYKVTYHSTAVMVEGVRLTSATRVVAGMGEVRLVSLGPPASNGVQNDAYEIRVPSTSSNLSLLFARGTLTPGDPGRKSLEVYDWSTNTWRGIAEGTGSGTVSVPLDPSEVSSGVVRLRVMEVNATSFFQVVSAS